MRTAPGKAVLWAALGAVVAFMLTSVWLQLPLPGREAAANLSQVLMPVSMVAMIPVTYLMMVPAAAKARWALKHRAGTEAEYREYRARTDGDALAHAGNPVTSWLIRLRQDTW